MALVSSSHFASVLATGTDWRDTSKAILEQLQTVCRPGHKFTLGFIYVSDYLAQDVGSIVNLFRSVLHIEHWTGCVGIGVCGAGEEYFDKPAVAAMIGEFPAESFCTFAPIRLESGPGEESLQTWKKAGHTPMLVLAHGDPSGVDEPSRMVQKLDSLTQGFVVGGLSTSRVKYAQVSRDKRSEAVHYEGGISGVAFSADIHVASALTQGCQPIGPVHRITRGEDHMISELDHQPATGVFEKDMRDMVMQKIGKDPDEIIVESLSGEFLENLPEDVQDLFKGEVHVAFPISESDKADYLVRNIIGMDDEEGIISVSESVATGDRVVFVCRQDETVRSDLARMLVELRQRVERQEGIFAPKAALYISCLARGRCDFAGGGIRPEGQTGEMKLIREVIGDIPLAGFYAGGEISNARLYGYTGVLTLFL